MPNFISCLTCTSYDGRLKIIKHLPDPSSGLQWIHGWPLCFLCKYVYPLTAIEFFFLLAVISVNTIFCQQVPLNAHLLDLVHACFELLSFSHQAPHLELVSANWKVRVNIFPSGLFIAAHPALSWCLILSGSRRRLPIVRSHDHPPAKVRRWMGFKGLQETWVRPPCLLVSPAPLSELRPLSPPVSHLPGVAVTRSSLTSLRQRLSLWVSDEIFRHLVQSYFCNQSSKTEALKIMYSPNREH